MSTTRLELKPDAPQIVMRLAHPALDEAAAALAAAIPGNVPVVRGVMQASYNPSVSTASESRVEVSPGSPFWHWMEFGNRYVGAFRPIQRAAESLGLDYTPL